MTQFFHFPLVNTFLGIIILGKIKTGKQTRSSRAEREGIDRGCCGPLTPPCFCNDPNYPPLILPLSHQSPVCLPTALQTLDSMTNPRHRVHCVKTCPHPTCTHAGPLNRPLHLAPKVNAGCWKPDHCPPRPTTSLSGTAPCPCRRPTLRRCDSRLTQSPLLPCRAVTHFNKPKDPRDTLTPNPRMNYTSQNTKL